MPSLYTAYGNTTGANWQQYGTGWGIFVNVDTSFARFPRTPVYSAILRGGGGHWATTGVTSIYNATANGFTVYIRRADGSPLIPQDAVDSGWYIEWSGTVYPSRAITTATAVTGSGVSSTSGWQNIPDGSGIFTDVDTSDAHFPGQPTYVCSLHGNSGHWDTVGGSSVYNPTANSFRVYVRRPDGRSLDRQEAQNNGWHIGWMGQDFIPITI